MTPIILRKPAVTVPAMAILAVACVGLAPAIGQLAASSAQGIHRLLSIPQFDGGMGLASILFVTAVLFLSGVVSGLAGFAFSAVAACVLWLLPPLQAVPLIMLLSACNQLLSIGKLHREMAIRSTAEREGALPYIIGGLAGVPVGVAMLRGLPTNWFAGGLGLFLIAYSAFMLVMPGRLRITLSGWKVAVAVGALDGVVGGFSGFGASILVVYLGLRGVGKSATRGITQPYILTMQLVSLGVLAATDLAIFSRFFWLLWAVTLPAVLLGSGTGVALYRRLSDSNFRRAVLILLILSGASLVAKTVI
jgi:hypothetical protein